MDPNRLQVPGRRGSIGQNNIPRRPVPQRQPSGTPSIGLRRASRASLLDDTPLSRATTRSAATRPPSPAVAPIPNELAPSNTTASIDFAGGRRRSSCEPRPYVDFNTAPPPIPNERPHGPLPTLTEESTNSLGRAETAPTNGSDEQRKSRWRTLGLGRSRRKAGDNQDQERKTRARASSSASQPEYDANLVNLLDVIDPEVSTLSTLTNVQNSLFIPNLGGLLNRRPTYNLSAIPQRVARRPDADIEDKIQEDVDEHAEALVHGGRPADPDTEVPSYEGDDVATITSHVSDSHYAVLPSGVRLEGWTAEEKAELDDHVRHMLHSRRSAIKRGFKGFLQYVRRPLGFFVTLYAFCIFVFGLTWVLFLIGWVSLGNKPRRDYIINVIDNVLVALFAVMGDGLIPWRIVDTYHMIYIAHYHHLTWNLRKKHHMPKLPNQNDLPLEVPTLSEQSSSPNSERPSMNRGDSKPLPSLPGPDAPDAPTEKDIEAALATTNTESESGKLGYYSVLTPAQQKKLNYHQLKFSKSHTFYKPHETDTHFAFPLRLLVAIVVILDFHSIFQIALGTCTWAIPYESRPFVLTTVILICSITCNATGGILISIGDKRTRKKDVRERMFRQELTDTAIKKVEKEKERRKTVELDRETGLETGKGGEQGRRKTLDLRRNASEGDDGGEASKNGAKRASSF